VKLREMLTRRFVFAVYKAGVRDGWVAGRRDLAATMDQALANGMTLCEYVRQRDADLATQTTAPDHLLHPTI
jgi:hypothetical protein